ncbi:hypothetical protein EB118_02175 [bacterium]|nr:hypothetical protein [bacterium]NDC93918.1 hypothetical protein [bacterium]NDD83249.1 hypothetical protein [bacterium]NDG28895.1 hypothetical protein [bacterium]
MPRVKRVDLITDLTQLAQKSTLQFRHSACVFEGRRVLSKGYNTQSLHAEVSAMWNSNVKALKGKDIQVIRIGANNELRNSRPCNLCIAKLKEKGIRKVYYSTDYGYIECEWVGEM